MIRCDMSSYQFQRYNITVRCDELEIVLIVVSYLKSPTCLLMCNCLLSSKLISTFIPLNVYVALRDFNYIYNIWCQFKVYHSTSNSRKTDDGYQMLISSIGHLFKL